MADRLLDAVRVLDLSNGVADAVTRLFADLGADVLKVEPPGGCLGRDALPTLRGASIPFAVHNANKRSTVLDPFDDEDCARFLDLAADADIVVDTGVDERGAMFGTSAEELAARYPHLVVLSITDSAPPARARRGAPPIRCCMRCAGRCRDPAPPPALRCCRRTASRRQPRPFRLHGPHSLHTTTDYVAAQAITSTSRGSTPS